MADTNPCTDVAGGKIVGMEEGSSMNIIPLDGHGVLVFNVFTVRPENQQELVDCIRNAGNPVEIPGLRSQRVLRSLDGTQVVNHMHWDSEEDFRERTASVPLLAATRNRVHELIEGAGPQRFEIVS
jgi:heme-degrading monooxygenase HmoA